MGLLVSLLWLAGSIALARIGRGPWSAAAAILCAAIAGTTLPDLDLLLPLGHRSALTHSLLPLAAALLARDRRAVAAGLAIGLGLHLAADCFPNAMRGFATVKLPGAGSIGAGASYCWLGIQAAAATAIGGVLLFRRLPPRFAWPVAVLLGAIGAGYLYVTDGGWPALCIYVVFGWRMTRRRSTSQLSSA